MANLGYVGLGAMGGRMADRLLAKGHTVTGYNRTKSKAQWLLDKGMKWADSPRAVAEAADVDVRHGHQLRRARSGGATVPMACSPASAPARLLIDMSTVSPAVSRALAAKVREKGADMVDAPVSGSVSTLEAGQAVDHGRRRRGDLRTRQAAARRHRPEGRRTSARTASRCR